MMFEKIAAGKLQLIRTVMEKLASGKPNSTYRYAKCCPLLSLKYVGTKTVIMGRGWEYSNLSGEWVFTGDEEWFLNTSVIADTSEVIEGLGNELILRFIRKVQENRKIAHPLFLETIDEENQRYYFSFKNHKVVFWDELFHTNGAPLVDILFEMAEETLNVRMAFNILSEILIQERDITFLNVGGGSFGYATNGIHTLIAGKDSTMVLMYGGEKILEGRDGKLETFGRSKEDVINNIRKSI